MQEFADVVFRGGSIFAGSPEPTRGHAVLVREGRIAALVPEAELDAHVGANTEVVDLDGGLLLAGFQDAHIHPAQGGVELLQCNLTEAESAEEAVATIAAYAAANPDLPWIQGGGWSMDHYPGGAPLASLIDAVVADRPVALSSRDHHSLWANSAAFRAAGLDASIPDPDDGRIERLADGSPAGTLHEGAQGLVEAHAPVISEELLVAGLLRAQSDLIAQGITGWQDALVGEFAGIASTGLAYERAITEGKLKVRVRGAQWWKRDQGLEQLDGLIETRAKAEALGLPERFNLGTVKIMVDGIAENFTASMVDSYRDCHGHDTGNKGLSFIAADDLATYVTALDAAGFQVHFHALGDRAVRDALNAVEAALKANGPSGLRHHLAHLQVVSGEDTARFAELGAVANLQPLWACHEDQLDELTLPFMPVSAEDRQYPFGELHARGALLAAGSDWPVSSADPIAGVHIAVNRIAPEEDREPLGGEIQRLDLATALAAYTSGTAYVNHRDSETGSIAPGYYADLTVVFPNPFEVPAGEIYRSRVVSTWIDGQRVYTSTNQTVPSEQGPR
jgi:predicted amidohydrolase YtcJ